MTSLTKEMGNNILTSDYKVFVATRSFSLSDQHKFASLSGDFNPIHLNSIQARRTIAGQCVVYGIFGVLWGVGLIFVYW